MTPERKVVVITGASRGIGAQLSKAYRHIGYITADGTRCRMNFISGDGDQGRISLPTECLSESHNDIAANGEAGVAGSPPGREPTSCLSGRQNKQRTVIRYKDHIVTLATPDEVEVSFGFTRQQMTDDGVRCCRRACRARRSRHPYADFELGHAPCKTLPTAQKYAVKPDHRKPGPANPGCATPFEGG
jgi:hypothetical protein